MTAPIGPDRASMLARQLVLPRLASRTVEPPSVRLVQEQPPEVIVISVPREAPASSCAGTYVLSNETANSLPCWMLQDGSHWLFSSLQGRWVVGGSDLRFDEFWRNWGYVSSSDRHYGRMPQRLDSTSWNMWTGAESVDDACISVTVPGKQLGAKGGPQAKAVEPGAGARELLLEQTDEFPSSMSTGWVSGFLLDQNGSDYTMSNSRDSGFDEKVPSLGVATPNWQRSCSGLYVPVQGTTANGMPVWERQQGDRWIFCGKDDRWYIGGKSASGNHFSVASGFICHAAHNRGRLPHDMGGSWLWGDTCAWHEDPSISVFAVPQSEKSGETEALEGHRQQPLLLQ